MSFVEKYSNPGLEALPESRQTLLHALKQAGNASAGELAETLGLTREATRQQLLLLQQQGLVESRQRRQSGAGRPALMFSLTGQGEHLFPKHYDRMTVILVDTVTEELGTEQLSRLLSAVTDKQVAEWQDKLKHKSLKEKLLALKDFYFEDDPYTRVVEDENGLWLIEQNCPFLNLAVKRPALCSVTVSTLTRLLGVRVAREKRFQNGDGQCAFHVLADQPVSADFRFEFEQDLDAQ